MGGINADHILDIDRKLAELTTIPSESCIFRVHDRLRNENEKAYEPEVVAIGPYHHGRDNLQPMEEHKLRYLKQLLNRRNETSAERYIVAMRESEQKARRFYADPIGLLSNEFVEMMLLDSCFIVELLRKNTMRDLIDPQDRIFQHGHTRYGLCRDLMLFENQLPFFIVMQLFNMTNNYSDSPENLVGMLVSFFGSITPGKLLQAPFLYPSEDDFKHLLGLLHYCFCSEFHSMVSQRNIVEINDLSLKSTKELQQAGIKFRKTEGLNLFDIRFENGTMEIPTLQVGVNTESFFRNLIAYEQYLPDSSWNHFRAYQIFMCNLVNTSKDVEILTHNEIIHSFLGDSEVVAAMLNNLGNYTMTSYVGYEEVYKRVNEYCMAPRNFWLATIRRDLDKQPWALLSFNYAAVLLLLTVLQTIFSALSVQKSN